MLGSIVCVLVLALSVTWVCLCATLVVTATIVHGPFDAEILYQI